ncbi:major facilitator superfamily-domain-containing protein [Annulohypoxylon maeteangense]|uniref:major facilitator superfamily-domain-containing protein n=1 Tax=Annulohypoxylon maeteangense TaxID=1927788 RepID=UPI0020076434|nr:major facilitator superfamily-domain-containing protein [Annulohypoxylon maeteangense]KAI0881951.1 major facilitator superfamily-domain-containing protein [Annulohypoxylon maeteangense]
MSAKEPRKVSIRLPSVPEPSSKRYSKRMSTFDPDNAESLENWRRKTSQWDFGSELNLLVGTPDTLHRPQSQSGDRFTFLENSSEEQTTTSGLGKKGSAFSEHDPPGVDEHQPPPEGGDEAASPKEIYPGLGLPLWREVTFIIVICLSMFTTQLGLGQVLLLLPSIGRTFNVSNAGDLSWLVAGYSLTVGTFILVSGRLGDIYGYKLMLSIGYAWFAVWTMISGLSIYNTENGYVMFVFARVLSGIGPAITMPNGLAIFGAAYPDGMRKAMAFALFGACAPSGSIVGATFSALFELVWWPWTFFSFAIILAILAGLVLVFVPTIPRTRAPPTTLKEFLQAVDLLGGVVGVTSLVLINFAWNQAVVVGWRQDRDYVYICLLLGILMLPCFFIIETKVAKEPLIPFAALTSDVGFVMACIACGWGCFGIWLFYLLQFYSNLRHGSPLQISAWFSPIPASGFAASITTGIILGKVRSSIVMVMSMTFFLVGVILVAVAPVEQSYWAQTFVCSLIIPWGMDMSFPAGTIIMSASLPKQHQGVAASLINTVVNYSVSLGLGFAGTVEMQVDHGGLTEADDLLRGYRGALYLGIGLAGLGVAISIIFAIKQAWDDSEKKRKRRPASLPDNK